MSTDVRSDARTFGDLGPRVLSALVLALIAIAALWAGGVIFGLFWLAAALAILWEWQALIGDAARRPRFLTGAIGLTVAAAFASHDAVGLSCLVLAAAAVLTGLVAPTPQRTVAAAGVLYAGALVVSVIALRQADEFGFVAIAWLFAIVWGTDVMAYFGGRLIGGPKLWPRVSAGKTWSGTLLGVVGGALLGLAVALAWSGQIAIVPLFVLGLLLAIIAQAGDLAESALKRRFGVKDSGSLIPGHGGVMDRLDGFTAACVCAALFGALRLYPSIAAGLLSW